MKPTQNQIAQLNKFLTSLHGTKLPELASQAKVFADYLNTLSGFKIKDIGKAIPSADKHVGCVIVDGVLQVGKDFEKQVRPAVKRIHGFPQAATVSGFIRLLNTKPLNSLINFKTSGTKSDLLMVARFFTGKGIETFDELCKWLEPETNRDSLLTKNSGLSGKVFRIADKTADYFRVLVRHWDAVAVDRGIRELLDKAKVISKYSKRYGYKETRSIVQLTAVSHLGCRPVDLDKSIYDYYVSNKPGHNKPQENTEFTASASGNFKYCIYCGVRMPHIARYCPKCGGLQP